MSRLASLQSTPKRSRSSPSPSPSPAASPAARAESTHHRMLKLVLVEVRSVLSTWDDILLIDGLKAGKGCIDQGTEMEWVCSVLPDNSNILQMPDGPERPRIGPHLELLAEARAGLTAALVKLDKLLMKLCGLIEQAEKILFEAYRVQSADFVLSDPMWTTWTLETFVNSIPPLLSQANLELAELSKLAATLLSPSTKFEDARAVLERWRDLGRGGARWEAAREWEDLVALELPDEEERKRKSKR